MGSAVANHLEPWCATGASGALRIVDPPGGSFFLLDGRLVYAECPLVSGVDRLLTASGRLPLDTWRAALVAGRAGRPVGDLLLGTGGLSRAELELAVVSAILDAALFLFDAAVVTRFEPGATSLLGTFCAMDFSAVCREVERRRSVLAAAWPDPAIDTAAVVPARRLHGHHVALTAVQWEIIANADRRRTPADLARTLGRETFVMLLEARRLARAGLIEPGRPGGSAVAESVAAVRASARAAAATVPRLREPPLPEESPEPAAAPAPPSDAPLPRRLPDERSWPVPAVDNGGPGAQCPDSVLVRIRRGLAALR